MDTNLKFFQVEISANRNYAFIKTTDFFVSGFDRNEIYLLKIWFKEYVICSQYSRSNVQILSNDSNIWLAAEFDEKDVFSDPETLKTRLENLHQIEADFFKQVDSIKQPKF